MIFFLIKLYCDLKLWNYFDELFLSFVQKNSFFSDLFNIEILLALFFIFFDKLLYQSYIAIFFNSAIPYIKILTS